MADSRRLICLLALFVAASGGVLARKPHAASADEFPAALTRFHPLPENPVFKAAGPGHWDVKIRERGWIVREGTKWRLRYTGFDGTREGIKRPGLAHSPDGIHWQRDRGNPLLEALWVEDMQVVRHADSYLMFAEGRDDQPLWLTSRDGVHWESRGSLDIRTSDGAPLTAGPVGTPTVLFDDGVWYLFYERNDKGVWLARSRDLERWTNVRDEPVMRPGPEPYDREMIALNKVIRHEGRYYGYYHGTGTPERPRIWSTNLAVSTDLIHWRKYPGNPLLPERDDKSSGIVVYDGRAYRLYTMHNRVDAHVSEP